MNVAREQLNIPMVVHPEDLASPHLDDLSGMTYLSYYMMPDSPGYFATRREIRKILQSGTIDNFTVRCIFFFSSAAHLLLAFCGLSSFACQLLLLGCSHPDSPAKNTPVAHEEAKSQRSEHPDSPAIDLHSGV